MQKKNNKRKRKKRPLIAGAKHQAHASLRGYLYQIWHSVNAWLDLADDEVLYLEGAEDFDKISGDIATSTQVKHTQHNITLRSQEVISAINNFWKLRTDNPARKVKFRFLTTSKIGKEQGNPFGTDKPGLELWSRCSGDEVVIKKISDFLRSDGKISVKVTDFLKGASPQEIYEQLIEPITWETDSKPASFVERSISDKLVLHGNRYSIPIPPPDAKKVVDTLLKEAWTVATQPDNRELTKARFLEIFYERTTENVPNWYLQYLQMQVNTKNSIEVGFPIGSSEITIQSYPHIQTDIPPLYLDVVVQRTDLLIDIQTKLQSDGIVVIQGGVDKGKTTLAKLTANAIDGDWFWLKFTNKEAPQIVQDLQQLADAVSNRSAQVNVILDDLNLQPQQLQEYEEDLGVVAYRILERGAKLLITSQYNSPNNLIRSLGVSKTITVDVPNFTESEIKQFAIEMECPPDDAETWTVLIQAHTGGHPRLVHAWFVRLREEGWNEQNIIKGILQPPDEVVEEREAARQLLTNLPENQREFLYRLSLMFIGFRKDYALNIAEIPEPISHPGDVFSQLVGPWIDQIDEIYYTISPLLSKAADQVWTERKIEDLHAHIANAILKTKEKTKTLTATDAWAVLTHSMVGQNKEAFISVIYTLMTAPQDNWENICQEFSWIPYVKTKPPEELFPGDVFVNHQFRSLQFDIAVEIAPEFAPNILEIWDQETKPYEPRQSFLMARLMLATRALKYNHISLPAKKLVGYLKEIIEITDNHKDVGEMYFDSYGKLEEHNIDNSNFFSFLFSFVYMRPDINVTFLNDLIDALDELDPKTRTLLLADFGENSIEAQLLNNGVWLTEEKLENPNWTRCLEVFDKVIEKTMAWGYPYIAAASARIKAITHDEKLNDSETAHKVLQDITSKVGSLPMIEEARALVYLHQEHYREALNIYDRILPEWNPPSEQLNIGPLEEYRRAAICASNLDDWKKAANFLEVGAKKTQEIEDTDKYIGLYADAGFAYFKAGKISECIKLLYRSLQDFETLPQNDSDLKYFTLKKRLEHTIKWIWKIWCVGEVSTSNFFEPYVGFCSDPTINEEIKNLPDCPIGYSWLYLSRIEYRFGHETTVFQSALQNTDKEEYPILNYWLSYLETQYDFRNKSFKNMPQRIFQLAQIFSTMKKHQQSGRGAGEKGAYSISNSDLNDFASIETIVAIFTAALIIEMRISSDTKEILAIWRSNSSELPINESIYSALDLIEPILLGDYNEVLTVISTPNEKVEKLLAASVRVMHNTEVSLEDLLFAHTYMASSFINSPWEDFVVKDLADLLSVQWLEKIQFRAKLKTPMLTVPQIEQACKNSETGKKKIGQILLAVHPAVSVKATLETLQQFRSWIESGSTQKQDVTTRKNPTAQQLIKAMEKPPHLTHEDVETLRQSIEEGKIPINFDSPFEPDERE